MMRHALRVHYAMVDKSDPSGDVKIIIHESQVEIARRYGAKIHRTSAPTKRLQTPDVHFWVESIENVLGNKDTYVAVFTTVASATLFFNALKSTLHGAASVVKAARSLGDVITKKQEREAATRDTARLARQEKAAERRKATTLAIAQGKEATRLAIAKDKEATKLAIAKQATESKEAARAAKIKKVAEEKATRITRANKIATEPDLPPSRKS